MARRRAMSSGGKGALAAVSPAANTQATAAPAASRMRTAAAPAANGRVASMARRKAMSSSGKSGIQSEDRIRTISTGGKQPPQTSASQQAVSSAPAEAPAASAPAVSPVPAPVVKPMVNMPRPVAVKRSAGRASSLARRQATSSRGKAGINKNGMSAAQTARAANPKMSSRELAMTLREDRSRNGASGQKKSAPCGRVRKKASASTGAAEDQPWKVGGPDRHRHHGGPQHQCHRR